MISLTLWIISLKLQMIRRWTPIFSYNVGTHCQDGYLPDAPEWYLNFTVGDGCWLVLAGYHPHNMTQQTETHLQFATEKGLYSCAGVSVWGKLQAFHISRGYREVLGSEGQGSECYLCTLSGLATAHQGLTERSIHTHLEPWLVELSHPNHLSGGQQRQWSHRTLKLLPEGLAST